VVDLDQYRSDSLSRWDGNAANWALHRDFMWSQTEGISRRLIDRLDPKPGATILDVAAGTGDTGFLAAERVGAEGRVITSDFAEGMVAEARRAGEARGLENVEYRVLDAERMDLDDSSVDGVVSRWGYMLMADPGLALSETRRVLREDGRLSFAVWGPAERNPWAAIPAMEMVTRGHVAPPEPGGPGIFAMGDPARITELVVAAGFAEPEIEQFELNWEYGGADGHWRLVTELSAPLAEALDELDEGEQDSVRTAVRERIEPLIAEHGGVPGLCHLVLAT
jgi:SAM-dependent methyltransferase